MTILVQPTRAGTTLNAAPSSVQISMLGGFELVVDGRDAALSIGRRDALRLAKFLALAPNRRVHREQLVDALWPEAPFESTPNRLHKAAHFLRKAMGRADGIVLAGTTVALLPDAPVVLDVAVFTDLALDGLANDDARTIDRAISMYRGDLLPHDPYEEWLESDRQRLRERLRKLLRASGGFERLIALDPTDEQGHVGVMRALLRAGDRSGVLRQYGHLSRVLDEELGVEPGADARALRDRALAVQSRSPDRVLNRSDAVAALGAGRGRCSGVPVLAGRYHRATHRHVRSSRP